jgi:hypothetical protein
VTESREKERRILELEAELRTVRARMDVTDEPPWLTKDFHILYRVTERLVADIDAEKVVDLNGAKAQLRRLLPAFKHCEAARLGSQMKRGS